MCRVPATRPLRLVLLIAATAVLAFASAAGAAEDGLVDPSRQLFQLRSQYQPNFLGPHQGGPFQPVEQAVGDVDPLAVGMRQIEAGLRQPAGFDQVYRVPGDDETFMRIDGGLFAVFPRSAYMNSQKGQIALIPADTVFSIGPPDFVGAMRSGGTSLFRLAPRSPERAAGLALSPLADRLRVDSRIVSQPVQHAVSSAGINLMDGRSTSLGMRALARSPRPAQTALERSLERVSLAPISRQAASAARDETDDVEARREQQQFRERVRTLLDRAASQAARGPSSPSSK